MVKPQTTPDFQKEAENLWEELETCQPLIITKREQTHWDKVVAETKSLRIGIIQLNLRDAFERGRV